MRILLNVSSILLLVIAAWAFIRGLAIRRRALAAHDRVQYAQREIQNALERTKSTDPDEVVIGLQTLRALSGSGINSKDLDRIAELARSADRDVAGYASDVLFEVSRRAARA